MPPKPLQIRMFKAILGRSIMALCAVGMLTGGGVGQARAQISLDDLFDPPSLLEIITVKGDWQRRATSTADWSIVEDRSLNGHRVMVARYRYDDLWQYSAIRLPAGFQPGNTYPVLVYCHGGVEGLDQDDLFELFATFPGDCVQEDFILVAPTFRSEAFRWTGVGVFTSEGAPSPLDRDADDTMASLTALLANLPQADGQRVAVLGRSRGGNVAYHVAQRDGRIDDTVVLFGPSDLYLPELQVAAEEVINDGLPVNGGILQILMEWVVTPYVEGELTLGSARNRMCRFSPVYFMHAGLTFQIHHGTADQVVTIAHSERVVEAMAALQVGPPEVELFVYEGVGHNPDSMTGWSARAEARICAVAQVPVGLDSDDPGGVPRVVVANYPNPFSRGTTISLERSSVQGGHAKSAAVLELEIFDLAGRLIRRWQLDAVDATMTRLRWDGTDGGGRAVAPGVYLVRASDGNLVAVHKMVVLR